MTHSSCVFKRVTILKWQWSKAAAMLGDYKTFIETWGLAVNSAGFAAGQIGVQIDTLARRIEKLKADMQGLAVDTGNAGITKYLKEELGGLDSVILGLKQLDSTQVKIIAGSTLLIIGIASVASAMRTYALATEEAATATTLLGKASIFASKWNLVITALTAVSFVLGSYLEKLGDVAEAERQVTEQQDNNIAKANQQLDMYKQQDDFIETLISAHKKMQEQLDSGSLSDEKAIVVKKNMQSTLEELTKVTGDDGLAQLVAAGNYEEASGIEKKAYQSKSDEIKGQIKELQLAQIKYTEDQINCAQARIDKLQSETTAWGFWAQAIQKAMEMYANLLDIQINVKRKMFNSPIANLLPGGKMQLAESIDNDITYRESLRNWRPESVVEEINRYAQSISELEIKRKKLQIGNGIVNYQTPPPGGSTVTESNSNDAKNPPLGKTNALQSKVDFLELDQVMNKLKISTDKYNESLNNLKTSEELYGVTAQSNANRIAIMTTQMGKLKEAQDAISGLKQTYIDKINGFADQTGVTIQGSSGGNSLYDLAQRVSEQTGIPADLIWSQWYHESQGFSSRLYNENHNIGGMTQTEWNGDDNKQPDGSNYYMQFGSDEEFTDYFAKQILKYLPNGLSDTTSIEAYARALSSSGYYTDDPNKYIQGMYGALSTGENVGNGEQQFDISGIADTIGKDKWYGATTEQKAQLVQEHREQIQNADLLISYLKEELKREKDLADTQSKLSVQRLAIVKAEIENSNKLTQQRLTDANQWKTEQLAKYGLSITALQRDNIDLTVLSVQVDDAKAEMDKYSSDTNGKAYKEYREKYLNLLMQRNKLQMQQMPKDSYEDTKQNIDWRQNMAVAMTPYSGVMTYQDELNAKIKATEETAVALKKALDDMMVKDKNAMDTQPYKQYEQQLESVQKELEHLKDTTYNVRKFTADSFLEMANNGTKLKDIMKNVWRDIEKEALYAFMGIRSGSASIGNSIMNALGFFNTGGSKVNTTYHLSDSGSNTSKSSGNLFSLGTSLYSLFGHADGGIFDKEHIAKFAEGNKKEAIIPLEGNEDRGRSLVIDSAKELGMLNGVGVEPYLKNPKLAQQAISVNVQQSNEHIRAIERTNELMQQQNQMLLHMINNPSTGNTALQPVVLQQGMSMDQLSTMIGKGQSTRQIK